MKNFDFIYDTVETVTWIDKGLKYHVDWLSPKKKGEVESELFYLYELYGKKALDLLASELNNLGWYTITWLEPDIRYGLVPRISIVSWESQNALLAA